MAEFVRACQVDQRLALGAHHLAVVPLRARASQRFDPLSGPRFEAAALFSALVPPPAFPHRRCIRTYAAQHFWDGLPRFARRMMREDLDHVFCAGGKGWSAPSATARLPLATSTSSSRRRGRTPGRR